MPLQNNDLLLVNRNGDSHKYSFENLKRDVLSDIELQLTGLEWVTALPNRPNQISGTPNTAATPRAWNSFTTLLIGVGNDISNVNPGSTLVLTNVTTGNSGTYIVSAVDAGANSISVAYDTDTGGDIQAGNTFVVAAFQPLGSGGGVDVGATPPTIANAGDLWYNTDDGRLYIYYTDINSSQWVDASPTQIGDGSWTRTGTTLSPTTPGDSVDIGSGNIHAGNVRLDAGTEYEVNVKDHILNLISRLDAIEANEVIDDATDTSLLQLVANASARLDSVEARLTALEGGN